jgi:hypothetical protein
LAVVRIKKISELEPKDDLKLSDIVPIVDMDVARRKTKKTTVQDIAEVIDAVPRASKGQAGGVATLDTNARIPAAQLPGIAVTETFNVTSQAAMLALPAQMGDIALREDVSKTFILQGQNPTVLDNWVEFLTPAAPQTLAGLADVDDTIPPDKAALVFDPDTQTWRPAKIERLTDGGEF